MSDDIARLGLVVDADGFVRADKAMASFNRTAASTEKQTALVNKEVKSMEGHLRMAVGALGALGVGLSAREIVSYTNRWTDLNSRLVNATGSQQAANKAMSDLSKTARSTYSSLEATADSFLRNNTTLKELNYTMEKQLNLSDAINNSLVVSGTKGQRAESVMNALSKAFAFGELRGDNFNTVIENGDRLVKALADGLGVGTLELRAMAQAGELKTGKVIDALTSQMEKLREEAEAMPATIGDAFGQIGNSVLELVGRANAATGASAALADEIINVADSIKVFAQDGEALADVVRVLADGAEVLAVVMGVRVASSMVAATARTLTTATAMGTLNKSMALLGGPVGIALLASYGVYKLVDAYQDHNKEARDAETASFLAQNGIKLAGDAAGTASVQFLEAKKSLRGYVEAGGALAGMSRQMLQDSLAAAVAEREAREGTAPAPAPVSAPELLTGMQDSHVGMYKEIQKEMAAVTDGINEQIAALEQQQQALGMTARAAAIYNAVMGANPASTPDQINRLVTLTAEIFDQRQAILASTKAKEDGIAASEKFASETKKAADELADFLDPTKPQTFGDALRGAFDGAGDALVKLATSLDAYGIKQAEIDQARANASRAYYDDSVKLAQVTLAISKKETQARLGAYGDMTGAASEFFDEQSAGYQGLQTASKIFHAAELAMQLKEMVPKAVNAVLNQGNGDPYTAFGRMAAMAAIVGGLGVAIGGAGAGGAPSITRDSFAGQEANNGAGTILGDAKAQSDSIVKSLSALEEMAKPELTYTSQMVDLLKSINGALAGTTKSILSSGFDLSGSSFMASSSMKGGGIMGAIFGSSSSSTSLADLGLAFAKQTISEAMTAVQLQGYQVTQRDWKKSGFLGMGSKSGTDYSTSFSSVDSAVSASMTDVLRQMVDAVTLTGQQLGATAEQIAAIQGIDTGLGKISLKDKTGEEVQQILTAVFSTLGDSLAEAVLPSLRKYQEIGEGSLETLTRVASTNEYVIKTFDTLGLSLGLTGAAAIDATMSFSEAMGGLSAMTRTMEEYYQNFYTEAEQQNNLLASLATQFEALGMTLPDSREGFRALVEAQDLSTESGRELFSALMQMSSSFADAVESTEELSQATNKAVEEMLAAERKLNEERISNAAQMTQELKTASELRQQLQMDIATALGATPIRASAGVDDSFDSQISRISQQRNLIQSQYQAVIQNEHDLYRARISLSADYKNFIQSLKMSDGSPLSEQQKYLESQRNFRDLATLAQKDDIGALQGLQEAAQQYISASQSAGQLGSVAEIIGIMEPLAKALEDTQYDPIKANDSLIQSLSALDEELQTITSGINDSLAGELKSINVNLGDYSEAVQASLTDSVAEWIDATQPTAMSMLDVLGGIKTGIDLLPVGISDYMASVLGSTASGLYNSGTPASDIANAVPVGSIIESAFDQWLGQMGLGQTSDYRTETSGSQASISSSPFSDSGIRSDSDEPIPVTIKASAANDGIVDELAKLREEVKALRELTDTIGRGASQQRVRGQDNDVDIGRALISAIASRPAQTFRASTNEVTG